MKFLKKNWGNIILLLIIALLIFPQTRKPIQVAFSRLIAFAPSKVATENRKILDDYTWDLYNLKGEKFNLKAAKGDVAVVNLWATWCPPCIAEMPSFQKLYEDYGEKVQFYFVSSEETSKLEDFIIKNSYTLPVFRPGSVAPEVLRSKILPTTYVISGAGEIVVHKKGPADWNDPGFRELLDKLLLEKTP
ncbi:MAG TPA: TlpA disulfide reductase family protein [Salinimicrobium sp.]|nr:TlpA disulfide reductase family protein [Salinimicrobium sp.]